MDYEKYMADGLENAKKALAKAQTTVKVVEFSQKVYAKALALTENPKFSYEVASKFEFHRILNSKEFTEEEKSSIKELEAYYKLKTQAV